MFLRIIAETVKSIMKDCVTNDPKERSEYQSPRIETMAIKPGSALLSTSNENWGEEALWV